MSQQYYLTNNDDDFTAAMVGQLHEPSVAAYNGEYPV
jgi:hypothetical protein